MTLPLANALKMSVPATLNVSTRIILKRSGIPIPSAKYSPPRHQPMRQSSLRIQIEFCPNPDCVQIHFSEQLTDKLIMFHGRDKCWNDEAPKNLIELKDNLFSIKGMDNMSFSPYRIQMLRSSSLFAWNDILPQAEKLIRDYFA